MRSVLRILLAIFAVGVAVLAFGSWRRVDRVNRAAAAIPVYPGAREGGGRFRYFPQLLSWDDRSSARVRRVFALSDVVALPAIARHAHATLAGDRWYLVDPGDLDLIHAPQVIVWQREPDERLDLAIVWPLAGVSREQRLYGGIFPAEFLDAPLVIEWSWALGGPRSPRLAQSQLDVRSPLPPLPPALHQGSRN